MKRILIVSFFAFSIICASDTCEDLKEFKLEDTNKLFIPVQVQSISRYDDVDICEIFWQEELDCPTPPIKESIASPINK